MYIRFSVKVLTAGVKGGCPEFGVCGYYRGSQKSVEFNFWGNSC